MENLNVNNGLEKHEILRSKLLIDKLFESGKRKTFGCLLCVYLEVEVSENGSHIELLTTVPKKKFKRAVDRNLIRRRIREAYRLNKQAFHTIISAENRKLLFALMYRYDQILPYADIEKSVIQVLHHFKNVGANPVG